MSESEKTSFEPKIEDGKFVIRTIARYDAYARPIYEERVLDAVELKELKERNVPFEIVTVPKGFDISI